MGAAARHRVGREAGRVVRAPLLGPFAPPPANAPHSLGAMQDIHAPMRRFAPSDVVDYAIVGVGSGGGVLLQRLARAGFEVIGFEAGPFWDTERDWVSDEAGSHGLYWTDPRVTGGETPLALGSNNCGRGVGGGSVHWASFCPRLHPSDFEVHTLDGVGADWPLTYDDLLPYYEQLELEMPVSGPAYYPWGRPHGYPYGPHPMGGAGNALIRGCAALDIPISIGGPVAITAGSHGSRPHCIYRGFCIQGCKVGAKASTLVTHVPDAIERGAEIRSLSMVTRISLGADNRADGVFYKDLDGKEHFQRARAVIVAGYAIETPRLLLNSACAGYENGLANSSGTVGRYLMAQIGDVIAGRFDRPVRQYKAPPAHALTEEFYETDPRNDFVRGYAIQTVGPLPIAWAKQVAAAKDVWGWNMREAMMDFNHWVAFGLLGEILPWHDNTVTLDAERDRFGLPIARVTFAMHENDLKLRAAGVAKTQEIMSAAGATQVMQEPRFAHLVGGARMGSDGATSVCDKFGRTHDIANLFICDGSVFPTQGSANPGLTIQALAARAADYLVTQGTTVFTSEKRGLTEPTLRKSLAPPETWGHGVPRLK